MSTENVRLARRSIDESVTGPDSLDFERVAHDGKVP
jgi:hypothetical protein